MDPSRTTIVGAGQSPAGQSWSGASGAPMDGSATALSVLGQNIGPYRILDLLGEGGFGLVYLAEQEHPVRRRVALKVIKPGMDSAAVIARFEAERQALALMDHTCVAKVFDAGTTPFAPGQAGGGGRPYFVMEYVPGVPITEYCDTHRLTTRQRLGLFIQVCEAVQHAHQKGIIHRDIKPSNVLVTSQRSGEGDVPLPKVIDFGVAKAVSQRLTDRTLFTQQGQLVGTPEYMSPEQAAGSNLDVDTRTDVYSLGILLYELLTGSLPFDAEKMRRAAVFEVQRMIREIEPPRPSVRLSTIVGRRAAVSATPSDTSHGDEIAARRRTDLPSLARQLRGDLDWITLRAMEKERSRRYETPSGLAADLRRHLLNEPVLAGPPSATYRLSKFVRRNRVPVAAGGVVFVALVAGLVLAAYGLQRARLEARAARTAEARERSERTRADLARDAEAAQRLKAQENAVRAEREAAKAKAVNAFLGKMLEAADPAISQGRDLTVRDLLDEAGARLEKGELAGQPEVESSARSTLGVTYLRLGLVTQAEPHLRRALALREAELGPEHEATLDSLNELGMLLDESGQFDEAEGLFRRALAARRRLDPGGVNLAVSINNLGSWLHRQGRLDEAEAAYREAVDIRQRVLGPENFYTVAALDNLGVLLQAQGRSEDAEPICREVLRVRREILPPTHPDIALALNNLAGALMGLKRYAEAESLFRESVEIRRRVLGPDHPELANGMNNIGGAIYLQGRPADAEKWLRDARTIQARRLGPSALETVQTSRNLASVVGDLKRGDEAEALLLEAYQGALAGNAIPGALIRGIASDLASLYQDAGKADKAAEWRARSQ